MKAMEKLDAHLKTRVSELRKMQKDGKKIIGYAAGNYMPEELVDAAGAVPVQLIRGGDPEPVMECTTYGVRAVDTYCRSQISYRMSGDEPLYNMLDLLVCPSTDHNIRIIGEWWHFWADSNVFKYGVPHMQDDLGLDYYLGSLQLLKEKLESFTGNKITDEKLKDAIAKANRMRELFKEISLMRKSGPPPISSSRFVKLSHAALWADRDVMLDVLESLVKELKETKPAPDEGKARVMLTGSTLAMGDYKVLDLMEKTDAEIVIEFFDEGMVSYWENVDLNGDLMKALSDRYFMKQVIAAYFRPSRPRMDHLVQLARDFAVDGILWYELLFRDGIDCQSHRFPPILRKEYDIPFLKLQSDWDREEKGVYATRIEAFVEMMRKNKEKALAGKK